MPRSDGTTTPRRDIPERPAVAQLPWRTRRPSDVPADVPSGALNNGRIPGIWRCTVDGLERGPCQQERNGDGPYCRYHEKLAAGLMEPSFPGYPVWPLPNLGYVLKGMAGLLAAA